MARARFTLLLFVCATLGCRTLYNPFSEQGTVTSVRINVRNDNNEDIVVYAVANDGTTRLGTVTRRQVDSFVVPWTDPGELRIRIEILAGPRYTSNPLSVAPGSRVELLVPFDAEALVLVRR